MSLRYLPRAERVMVRFEKGSLLAFTFLHTLTLGNNRIGNLQVNATAASDVSAMLTFGLLCENPIIDMQQTTNVEQLSTATSEALGVFASRRATSKH